MRIPVYSGDARPARPEREEPDPVVPVRPDHQDPTPAGPVPMQGQGPAPAVPQEPGGYPFSMEPARPAAADYQDLYLRAMADMANYRRRMEARAQEQVEEERRRLLNEILTLADNLDRALAHKDEPGLREGLRLTKAGLERFLAREGVEPVETAVRPFDPQVHEAVSVVHANAAPGQVVEEVQRGYRYHGRLLRPARVVVQKG
jgi:molecular chaperone GrpE